MSNKKVEPMCYFYNEREKGGKSREDWMVGERKRNGGQDRGINTITERLAFPGV